MKIYKIKSRVRIVWIIIGLLLFVIGPIFFLVYNKESTVLQRVIMLIGIIMGLGGAYSFGKVKIILENEKIEVFTVNALPFLLGRGIKHEILSLNWDEIGELHTNYVLYPESPIIVLKPRSGVQKKRIEFLMAGMPLQLLKDILFHLSPDAKVYLYPYLKRKLEGKQTWFYTK